jgi:uncharacterized protein YjbJ (UPF0337 family)
MWSDRELKARERATGLRAAAARVGRERLRAPGQARGAANAAGAAASAKGLVRQQRSPNVRSAREDAVRASIDKFAGRVLEAFGKLTGNKAAIAKGKAARGRGAGRSFKGRVKRLGR